MTAAALLTAILKGVWIGGSLVIGARVLDWVAEDMSRDRKEREK